MLLASAVNYVTGQVRFCAVGGFPERFVNLCRLRGIAVTDISIESGKIEGVVAGKDYRNLSHAARDSGMKLCATEKKGLIFFLRAHKNRVGLLIGAVFFVLFISVMSQFVWSIEISGNNETGTVEIAEAVSECGLHIGSFKKELNAKDVSNRLMTKLNGKLLWAAVNLDGCRAFVEVRDYIPPNEDETYKKPCNIVADFDGIILSVDVFNGKKAISEGSGVKKGDLLISGISPTLYTSSVFREARGRITALHDDEVSLAVPGVKKVGLVADCKRRYSLFVFGAKIPLGFFGKGKNYTEYESLRLLEIYGVKLPVGIITTDRVYTREGEAEGDVLDAVDLYTDSAYAKFKNTNILSQKLTLKNRDGKITVSGKYSCIDFIGVKKEIKLK